MQRVAVLVFEHVRLFDLAVIDEVWAADRQERGVPRFEVHRCGEGKKPIQLPSGMTIAADRTLAWLARADLIVVPGIGNADVEIPESILAALRRAHRAGTQIAALCAGAFVVAAAGLLDGHTAITHWAHAERLAAKYPDVTVDASALFVEADGVWTSAGVAAGIDLCLHLVRQDHGAEVAAAIARSMVTAPFRTGGQAQFVAAPTIAQDRDGDTLSAVRERALHELHKPLSVAQLAKWAAMSERTFSRRFAKESGTTPLRWLLDQRIAAAQKLLERTDFSMDHIAEKSGFGSAITMRQHFVKHLSVSPSTYRRTFHR
jgi:transcriptional regulator GlxA family with amidase domain